jgi:hypothetical protein
MHCEDKDFEIRQRFLDSPGGLQSVEFRHFQIEHRDVRRQLHGQPDCLAPVGSFAAHLPRGIGFKQAPQSLSHYIMVVNQKDADGGVLHWEHGRTYWRESFHPGCRFLGRRAHAKSLARCLLRVETEG